MSAVTIGEPRTTDSNPQSEDDLDALAARLVSTWPALDDAGMRQLGQLLAAA